MDDINRLKSANSSSRDTIRQHTRYPSEITESMNENETLLKFPCEFPIKAMGLNSNDFELRVVDIVRRHTPNLSGNCVNSRQSKTGKYVSVTITINAQNKQQLDLIYQDLSDCTEVLTAL